MSDPQAARENPNWVPVDELYIPDWDIRDHRPEEDIRAIMRSLDEEGQVVPILLGRRDDDGIEVVDGVHRFLAAKRLGWKRLDGIQLSDDRDVYTDGVVANLAGVALSNHDKVNVLNYLFTTTDMGAETIGEKVGLSKESVYRYKRVIEGYNEIRRLYMEDGLALKAAAKLNRVPDRDVAVSIAEEALTKGWNQKEIIAQASNAKARLDMDEEAREASRQVGSNQAAAHAREQMAAQEAQAGASPEPAGQPPQPRNQAQAQPQPDDDPIPEDYDGPICDVCGGPRTEEETMTIRFPEAIQDEVGQKAVDVCMSEGKAVLQLVHQLQNQAPHQ